MKMLQMNVLRGSYLTSESPVFSGNRVTFNELLLMSKKECPAYTY